MQHMDTLQQSLHGLFTRPEQLLVLRHTCIDDYLK